MPQRVLRFALLFVVILSGFTFTGCATVQRYVENNEWLPVNDLDLIQLVQSQATSTNSADAAQASKSPGQNAIIGSRMSVATLEEHGFWWWTKYHAITPSSSLMLPDYTYNVKYVKGPEKILKKQNFSVEVTALNLGKWAKLGCSKIGASSKLDLKNIIHGYIDFKNEEFLGLLQSLDTIAKEKTFLITDFIAADIINTQAAGISCNADVNLGKYELKLAKINAGDPEETITLQGPGLLLGLRGYIIETTDSGSLDPFSLPKKNDYLLKELPLGKGNKLRIDRNADNSVELRIDGATAAKVYYRDIITGKWKLDTNTYALARIDSEDQITLAAAEMPSEEHKSMPAAEKPSKQKASAKGKSLKHNASAAAEMPSEDLKVFAVASAKSMTKKSIRVNEGSVPANAVMPRPRHSTNTTDIRIVVTGQSIVDVVAVTIHGVKNEASVRMYRSTLKRADTTENYTELAM